MPTAVPATVPACAFLSRRIGTRCAKHCRRPFQKDIHNWLRAGTLPAKLVPTNIEIQGGALPNFLFWTLVVRAGLSTLPKFRPHSCSFLVILEVILVILAVRAPLWLPRGPKRAPKAAQRRFCDILLGFLVSFGGPGGSLSGSLWSQNPKFE